MVIYLPPRVTVRAEWLTRYTVLRAMPGIYECSVNLNFHYYWFLNKNLGLCFSLCIGSAQIHPSQFEQKAETGVGVESGSMPTLLRMSSLETPSCGWGVGLTRQPYGVVVTCFWATLLNKKLYSILINLWPLACNFANGKEPTCQCRRHKRHGLYLWVRKIPWRRKWQPIPVVLPGEIHGWRSLMGYSPWGHKESDMTEWVHFHFKTK